MKSFENHTQSCVQKIEIFSRKYKFEQRYVYIFMQFLSLFAKIQLSYSVIENNRYFSLNPKG